MFAYKHLENAFSLREFLKKLDLLLYEIAKESEVKSYRDQIFTGVKFPKISG